MNELTASFYRKLGSDGLKKVAKEFNVDDDILFVKNHTNKDDAILDLGCGYGRVSFALAQAGYKDIFGIDLASNLIETAKKESANAGLQVSYDVGSMSKLPYDNNRFNVVICLWNAFNEIFSKDEQLQTLEQVHRVLKPGGKALFVLLDPTNLTVENSIMRGSVGGIETEQYVYSKTEIEELASKTTFPHCDIQFIHMHQRERMLVTLTK